MFTTPQQLPGAGRGLCRLRQQIVRRRRRRRRGRSAGACISGGRRSSCSGARGVCRLWGLSTTQRGTPGSSKGKPTCERKATTTATTATTATAPARPQSTARRLHGRCGWRRCGRGRSGRPSQTPPCGLQRGSRHTTETTRSEGLANTGGSVWERPYGHMSECGYVCVSVCVSVLLACSARVRQCAAVVCASLHYDGSETRRTHCTSTHCCVR